MEEDGSGGVEDMKAKEYGRGCHQDSRPASAFQMQRKAKTCLKVVPVIDFFWHYEDIYHHH